MLAFGDRETRVLKPRQGRLGLLGLLGELRREPAADGAGGISIGESVAKAAALARDRGLVVVVSDFRTQPTSSAGTGAPRTGRARCARCAGATA